MMCSSFSKVGRILWGGDVSLAVVFHEESNSDVSNHHNYLEVDVFGKILLTIPDVVYI